MTTQDFAAEIEEAIVAGDWPAVERAASTWRQASDEAARDPRPAFALNVVHLLRGEITGSQLWRELKLHNQLGVTRGQMAG